MKTVNVVVGKKLSLSDQPAVVVIQEANGYKSEVWVEKEGKKANAKSLLGVLSLGLVAGCSVTISAEGEDETEAIKSLEELVKAN